MTNWLTALRATCEKATKGPWRFAWAEGYNEDEPFPLCKTTWVSAAWPDGVPVIEGEHNDEPNVRYCATFNPQMVAAMIDVIEASECLEDIDLSCIDTKGYIPSNWCKVCKTKGKLKQLATEGREDGNI